MHLLARPPLTPRPNVADLSGCSRGAPVTKAAASSLAVRRVGSFCKFFGGQPWNFCAQANSWMPALFPAADSGPCRRIAGVPRSPIVHDWCPTFRGGERVLARLCKLFPRRRRLHAVRLPSADEIKSEHFPGVAFHTSVANRLPMVEKYYRSLFFACPFLIEQFDVTGYDAVISSSAAFARGVLTRPDQPHLCYVHSPIRYAWDEQFSYLAQARTRVRTQGPFISLSAASTANLGHANCTWART